MDSVPRFIEPGDDQDEAMALPLYVSRQVDDETRLRKKERTEMGQSRKSSLMDEEIRLKKAQKIVAGASNSILESGPSRTIDGVEIEEDETTDGSILRDVGTTKGSTISNPMGSERLDPPTC